MRLTLALVVILSYAIHQCIADEGNYTVCGLAYHILINNYYMYHSVVPETQMVYINEQAVFRCRHMSVDHYIQWRVDGMPVGLDAPPEINPGFERDENGNIIDTLNITATPDYNNSEVVCVSMVETQSLSTKSVSTLPAILRGTYSSTYNYIIILFAFNGCLM